MLLKLPKLVSLPEIVFLMIAIPFGIILCLLIPPGAGFDETTHMARVWEISGVELIPNQSAEGGIYLPSAFAEVSYRSQFFYEPVDYYGELWLKHIDWDVQVYEHTRSIYFPLPYLPLAALMGILGRVLDAPVLLIYFMVRFAQFGIYAALAFLAIRLVPIGKWILACLSLSPMVMFQATTVSMDAYTNGISFLFIAWILALHLQRDQLSWKQVVLTLVAASLLLAAKPGTFFLLILLLLLPAKRFPSRNAILALSLGIVVAILTLVAGWNLLVYQSFYLNTPGYGAVDQMHLIITQPLHFFSVLLRDAALHWLEYLKGWAGVHAYGVGRVPPLMYWLFGAGIIGATLLDSSKSVLQRRTRAILLLTLFIGYISTVLLLYLTANPIGATSIQGVQGRYFVPVLPLLLFAVPPYIATVKPKLAKPSAQLAKVTPLFVATSLLTYVVGIFFSFHTLCGIHHYTGGLCYQPQYRNWAPELHQTSPLTAGTYMRQSFQIACAPLRSIRVWTVLGDRASGHTLLEVQDSVGKTVASSSVENASIVQQGWWEVEFPPIQAAISENYAILLSSDLNDPVGALSFGVTSRQEYKSGQFVINGVPAGYDLIFQYGCLKR